MDDAVQNQLATIRKQLGALERVENVLGDIYGAVREIRTDVQELLAKERERDGAS